MLPLHLGELRVEVVVENPGIEMPFAQFLPELSSEMLAAEQSWLEPCFANLDHDAGVLAFHSYLIRTPRHNILVDTCVGNGKQRGHPAFHQLQTSWFDNLHATGLGPEQIDYVMCTHLHADHIGWNTQLCDGRWVPTFPRAKYVFARREFEHRQAAWQRDAAASQPFIDSILPVVESGQALLVDSDHDLEGHLHLEAAAGHTPGNVVIHLRSRGEAAVLSGDVIHHPMQVIYPECSAAFCEDRLESARCRRAFVERHADSNSVILPAHFPSPTAGRIVRHGARWRFAFLDS